MSSIIKKSLLILGGASLFIFGIEIGGRIKNVDNMHCGSLRLDKSEEDENTKIFLELEVPIETLSKMKLVSLKVINKSYILRK